MNFRPVSTSDGPGQRPGHLPQEHLQDRQEPLQVGLLVDREFDIAFVEQFLGFFGQVEATGLDAFGGKAELLHHASQFRGVATIDGIHPLRGRMAGPVGFDRRFLARFQGAGHDRGQFDRRTGFPDRPFGSFEARLQVRRAGTRGEDDHVAGTHGGDDPFAHQFAGQFQVLADVGQALVGGRGRVGVVGDDRDAGLQCVFDRHVERRFADQRHRDPMRAGRDGRVYRVDHLTDVFAFGARPLVAAAQQFAGVLDPVLGRDEERVRGHVVDDDEFVFRMRAEHARRAAAAARGARPTRAEQRAHPSDRHAAQGGAPQEGSPVEPRPVRPVQRVEPVHHLMPVIGI